MTSSNSIRTAATSFEQSLGSKPETANLRTSFRSFADAVIKAIEDLERKG